MPRRRRPPRPGALADLAPLRILKQIILLQIAYYVCAAVLIVFTALVAGKELDLDLLLSWRTLRSDITVGWMLGLVWLLNSLVLVVFLMVLVARSKLIPDFALTIHFLHLIVTSLYSHSLPTHWFWWILQITSAAFMTMLGIWSCQYRELRPISFGGKGRIGQVEITTEGGSQVENSEEIGYSRGRGRGRGRDGVGEYEMVAMVNESENA